MRVRGEVVFAGGADEVEVHAGRERAVETAGGAVDVAADCAVAEVDVEGEGGGWDGDCELGVLAVAGCFEGFCGHDC
jgi:hypothetical protein